MGKMFGGALVTGFIWLLFTFAIDLFKNMSQYTGYKAIFMFILAAVSLIFSLAEMWHVGNDASIAEKFRKEQKAKEIEK